MPIYEYQCKACGHEMETLQKISDDPLKDCPACDNPELTKKISAVGFRLKGGGWYETDFKSGSGKNLAGDSNATPAPESAPSAPATKSESSGGGSDSSSDSSGSAAD